MSAPRLLVVDDDPDLPELLVTLLTSRGYDVDVASNGAEALESIGRRLPALILLDMRMPVMDGWTFARIFRDRYDRRAPIVVLTAAESAAARATEIGAEGHLDKPFDLENLYAEVARFVPPPTTEKE